MNKCLLNLKLPMDSQVVGESKDWAYWKNLKKKKSGNSATMLVQPLPILS